MNALIDYRVDLVSEFDTDGRIAAKEDAWFGVFSGLDQNPGSCKGKPSPEGSGVQVVRSGAVITISLLSTG